MKLKISEIEKVVVRAKCYYDNDCGNPYSNAKVTIFLKSKVSHPSFCRASNLKVEFSTGVCWGHYGKKGCIELVRQFLEKIVEHKSHSQLIKKDWYMNFDVTCSYYGDVDDLVWD